MEPVTSMHWPVARVCTLLIVFKFRNFLIGFWRPDMSPEELTEAVAQTMLGIIERDASTGWGAIVYTITKDNVTSRALKCRMD